MRRPPQALERELREELGVTVEAATPFMTYRHEYPERIVELHVFLVERYSGEPRGVEGQPLRWVAWRNWRRPVCWRPIGPSPQR